MCCLQIKMNSSVPAPRPVPVIELESSFSRKKKPCNRDVGEIPRSPIKSAPPVSRIFQRRKSSSAAGACAVSFNKSLNKSQVESPLYTDMEKLYFDQCFTRLSFLGSGSFGHVVKAQSKEDGKLYAVKKSRQRFRSDQDRSQQLEEVNKNEQISGHRNCVSFYKAWEELDHLYIQTELCEMSLKDYAESVPVIAETEIWNMIYDLCRGLRHLHDTQLVHMDIKPANLFLGRDGYYKIGDFGLVFDLARDLSDAMDGDSKYLAPELMDGCLSKAVDIFSLGIAVLELACSLEVPQSGPLWHELRNNKLPLEFTQGLSDDLIILVSSMMDRNPENRPTVGEIIKRPCVIQACKDRHGHLAQPEDDKNTSFNFLLALLVQVLISVLKFFTSFFAVSKNEDIVLAGEEDVPNCDETPLEGQGNDISEVGQQLTPSYTPSPVLFRGRGGSPISPVVGRESAYFQPILDKKEMEAWKVNSPEIISPTPRSYCSTPRHEERVTPELSPVSSDVRSKLFGDPDSSSGELDSSTKSLSTNLLKVFDESENWD